jgi:hypothetical protein
VIALWGAAPSMGIGRTSSAGLWWMPPPRTRRSG